MSQEISFQVQGSEVEPYSVTFRREGSNFTARCTCMAGAMGQYCKHRFNLLNGGTNGLVSGNADRVPELRGMLMGSDVEVVLAQLYDAEAAFEEAKKEVAKRKKAVARAMQD